MLAVAPTRSSISTPAALHALTGIALQDARQVVEEFWTALRTGQFEPWFQPQVDVQTGHWVGFEALIRWNHPIHGVLAPGSFLPWFERFGLTPQLDRWTLERVMELREGWNRRGLRSPRVAVNLAPQTLQSERIVADVLDVFARFGGAARAVEVEVTEGTALDASCHENLRALVSAGIPVSLDDFGAGYAALATLADTAASGLKLDRSLIRDVHRNARQAIVVRHIIRLASELGLTLVAEGIECADQLSWCRGEGVSVVQGFGLCRPMPPGTAEARLRP